jgi:hypothetical protein
MNVTLGMRLSDGRRVGIQWRCTPVDDGTVVRAVLTHSGDLTDDDLAACLTEIGAAERIAHAADLHPPRRRPPRSR